ncbi:MAG: PDZ domain-containing protein [Clostridia bacterium]|nr:PDZ domain-containing protein [Clostridia bacterium]
MRKNKKYTRITSLLVLLAISLSFISCGIVLPNPDLLDSDAVIYRLEDFEEIPDFDRDLFGTVETCFNAYYYTELESNETLAEKTRAAYLEFCEETVNKEDKNEVTRALIDCYIYSVGDAYAFYRSAEESEDYSSDMSGSFVGIGISVIRNDLENTILITGIEQDSPASEAGLAVDDYIVGVDGERVSEIGTLATVNKIRGEENTTVEVTVLRGEEEITFTLTRKKTTETSVSYEILEEENIGYIKIKSFKGNTFEQFKAAVDAVEKEGVSGVIFDVRSNPGGYLTAVTDMLSYLVPTGTKIVSFSNSKSPIYATDGTKSEPKDHVLSIPSVVLCNETSASASELFSAAMRDYNDMGILDCTLVGELTYKKGVMQSTIPFNDGSSLTLTTALYNPPSDKNFNGIGVSPDRFIKDGEDYIEAAIEELIKLKGNQITDI